MRCRTTQGFGGNANPTYKNDGLKGHTGLDYFCGYQTPVRAEWPEEYVYKIFTPARPASDGFTGIFTIVEHDGEIFEFLYGHVGGIKVKEGQTIRRGQIIATEGNYGRVWQGGKACDGAAKLHGCGSHRHYQKRIIELVDHTLTTKNYLSHPKVWPFRYKGKYCLVPLFRNGYNGCVDFQLPSQEVKDAAEVVDDLVDLIDEDFTDETIDKKLWELVKKWLKRIVDLS